MNARIILADDHNLMRRGLISLLSQQPDMDVIGEAKDGREALNLVRDLNPDIVVMDIAMPDLNGIEATRQIRAELPKIKIIALSMHSDESFVIEMFKAGVSGYLLKDCAINELISAIHAVLAGKVYLSPEIAGIVVKDFLRDSKENDPSTFSVLTPREREVLQLIAEGKTTKMIAEILSISFKTVDTHRQQIMKKLDIHTIANLTKYAVRMGITPLEE